MTRAGRTTPRYHRTAIAALLACAALFAGCANRGGVAELTLSPAGDRLGPLDAGTRFDAAEIRALFPAATVAETTGSTEGEPYPVLSVADRGRTLLEIRSSDGARIDGVEITDAAPVAGLGVRHGAAFADVFDGASRPRCRFGMEEQSGQVVCPSPTSAHLVLVFTGTWDGPDGEPLPPETLATWTVDRIIWRP